MNYPFLHIIITRFNVPNKNWKQTKGGDSILSDDWMDDRFQLFENITLPSFKNQSEQNFHWYILFDTQTKQKYLDKIADLQKEYPKLTPLFLNDSSELVPTLQLEIQKIKKPDTQFVISADIDNDDALQYKYIETVQKLFQPKHDLVIDLVKGFKVTRINSNEAIAQTFNKKANPFVSLVEDIDEAKTIIKEKHLNYSDYKNYVECHEVPMYIQFIHEKNLLNVTSKQKALSGLDLKEFGISPSYLQISEIETKKFNKKLRTQKWKNLVLHYLNKSYSLAKTHYFRTSKKELKKKDKKTPILSYTNGKVGSSTIFSSIEKHTNLPVFHVHHLNKKYLSDYEKYVKKHYFKKTNRGNYLWISLLWRPLFVRKNFLNKKPLKFIIVWRDPIAKNISTFFEWIHFKEDEEYFYFHSHQYEMQFDIRTPKDDLSELIQHFTENFPHKIHENWLKIEQGETLNLPYKKYPFDQEKNFQIIENEKNKALVLKLEAFKQENYPQIIGDFCGIENFQYENANLTENKAKNKAYEIFKQQIQFPENLMEELYTSDFMTHYYSKTEIENFKKRWKTTT